MKSKLPLRDKKYRRRQRAIALVIVLAMVSMMTIFMLAIFSVSRTEHSSSVKYADGQSARELADTAVNVVMAQIWDGTQRTATIPALWASQPGAIRRYNLSGVFTGGYKLYSSASMQVNGDESMMVNDLPSPDWASLPGRYTDLNEPVIRPDKDGDGNPELVFPIIDPRAYQPASEGAVGSSNVEGFWYDTSFRGVQAATSDIDLNARLPMPVEWLYVLKNGMLGTVSGSGESMSFVPATSAAENRATEENPIVGRVAFWTDDESSKININTAGEPSVWSTPHFGHERELDFAHFQPMSHEYQRYPGHPATIAMSSVLFPNQDMDLYGKTVGTAIFNQILNRKERIYEVMPKLHTGGSRAGTVSYWRATDTNLLGGNLARSVDLSQSINERLYASVDDLMFAQRLDGNGKTRVLQDDSRAMNLGPNSAGVPIFSTPGQLERARFFLTAHSRVPEVNMYGMPRVAIWPVADEALGAEYRTGYDNLIAFCSSLGARDVQRRNNSYFFRRRDSRSATTDISIPRNTQLLGMLNTILTTRIMPGGVTFATKYDQGDTMQILVQIFDYIRSTNLYDGFLAPTREQLLGDGTQRGGDPRYRWETYNVNGPGEVHPDGTMYRRMPRDHRTFTADRLSRMTGNRGIAGDTRTERALEYTMPGHGSVVPSEFQGGAFRGMGRFPAITEVGFHFVCSGDGNPDKGSFRMGTLNQEGRVTKPGWPGFTTAVGTVANPLTASQFVGGRTAVRMDPMPVGQRGVGPAKNLLATENDEPMFARGERRFWYSNFPAFPPPNAYGTQPNAPANDPRSPRNHPGFRSENWNATLIRSTPLRPGERRVQGMINLEMCVPMLGYGPVHPEFTLVIEGLQNMTLNGQVMFNAPGAGRVIWKTGRELYHINDDIGTETAGGYVDASAMVADRRVRVAHPGLVPDPGYDTSATTSGDPYRGLRNYDLVSRYMTVSGDTMDFQGAPLTISVYAGHQLTNALPIQVYRIPAMPSKTVPVPKLIIMSSDRRDTVDPVTGGRTLQVEVHAPQWWTLSYAGALGRYTGIWTGSGGNVTSTAGVLNNNEPSRGQTLGRFATWANDRVGLVNVPRGNGVVYGYDANSGNHNSQLLNPVTPAIDNERDEYTDTGHSDMQDSATGNRRDMRGSDVLISMVSTHGDPRHILAKKVVEASEWVSHPKIDAMARLASSANPVYFAHNISRGRSNANPGFDNGNPGLRLVPGVTYNAAKVPDVPAYAPAIALASQFGDFDNGPGYSRDGGWLNKPDEGSAGVTWISQNGATRRMPTAYSSEEDRGADAGLSYMTPNRMMPSPGMFGSLPSRVKAGQAWRTLLFRPNTPRVSSAAMHPGAPAYQGGIAPADHYIMDLFWMPIVEPYAISETFSSAGKVNINYQIVPFRHIRRSTALHAALKGEIMAAIPNADGPNYLIFPPTFAESTRDGEYHYRQPWSDFMHGLYGGQQKVWHRKIEVEMRRGSAVLGTLLQFENRFNFSSSAFSPAASHGLFRTASQICEIHLMPKKVLSNPGQQIVGTEGSPTSNGGDPNVNIPYTPLEMNSVAAAGFWATRQLTGDNTKERPYANLYGKITTQSNTFRVFYKAQIIRKARSVAPDQFEPGRDRVASEYRGTTLIERKLDANDPLLPDYAASPGAAPLDRFYRFRVLETKRFAP